MREVLLWIAAALVGVAALAFAFLLPSQFATPLIAIVAVPVTVLIAVRRLAPVLYALSGVVVGVVGYWIFELVSWEIRCNAPPARGQPVCGMRVDNTEPLTVSIAVVAAALLLAAATAWITRAHRRSTA